MDVSGEGHPPHPLARVFDRLVAERRAPLAGLDRAQRRQLEAFGVDVARGWARIVDDVELLRCTAIRAALSAQAVAWLTRLEIRAHLPSTSTTLLSRARGASVAGQVLAVEVQTAARGRRGRDWHSPFGRNLALSLGFALPRPPAEMGAFSLVVGLAVRAAVVDIGVPDVALKWPNDVLLGGRKLAGILLEGGGPPLRDIVVGIGVNVHGRAAVAAQVDQPVADIAERVRTPVRNRLLAGVINRLVDATGRFAEAGFAPFKGAWEQAHAHQNQTVTLTPPTGGHPVTGTALGVDRDGSLRLATAQGVRTFVSGEVSLRAAPANAAGAAPGDPP